MQEQALKIRVYQEADAPVLAELYYQTIHQINRQDYSAEQVNAWAPEASRQADKWREKWKKLAPMVAVMGDKIVGFAEFESNGHIDCFYCHHDYQGCGVGSALMAEIEKRAGESGVERIYAEVSTTAKRFFEAKGFVVVKAQEVNLRGVKLTNFVMEKKS